MMLQIKPMNLNNFYKVFADKEYLLEVKMSGKVIMCEYEQCFENKFRTEKRYNTIQTFESLDIALRYIYERCVNNE